MPRPSHNADSVLLGLPVHCQCYQKEGSKEEGKGGQVVDPLEKQRQRPRPHAQQPLQQRGSAWPPWH